MNRFHIIRTVVPVSLLLMGGCSFGPGTVEPPNIDAASVAAAAIEKYDTDRDKNISKEECRACPSLNGSFELYDSNGDAMLSPGEIEKRLQAMLNLKIGRMPCICIVYVGGRPLVGARVELVPESFLDGAVQSGGGVTNGRGVAKPDTVNAPPGLPGVEFGLYRVRITHDDVKIPAKYNTETELGFELSPIERDRDTAIFRLKLNSGGSECER